MKKSDKPSHNLDLLQDTEAEPGQTIATGQQVVWSIKQMAARAEIIATLHFAAQNLSKFITELVNLVSAAIS